jgi:hypothetical protein
MKGHFGRVQAGEIPARYFFHEQQAEGKVAKSRL